MIAKTLQNSVRATDVVGRWEDDAFMVIAASVNEDQLNRIANKIRVLVEQSGFLLGLILFALPPLFVLQVLDQMIL